MTVILLWLTTGLGCAGAGGETGDPSAPPPTLSADLQLIFNRNCVGACHTGDTPESSLDLSEGAAHSSLVGVASVQVPALARVAPGEPDASYLLAKLEGRHVDAGGTGTSMPPGLVLADNELALFRDWISAGAPE